MIACATERCNARCTPQKRPVAATIGLVSKQESVLVAESFLSGDPMTEPFLDAQSVLAAESFHDE
eukprot:1158546-Pelagomonas_calceolata.AAC.2